MVSPIINQINTIFVHVSDLKQAVKWYSNLLGVNFDLDSVHDPVYNMMINHHTGLTLDAGQAGMVKGKNPSAYPLFNFHTDDIRKSYQYVRDLDYTIDSEIVDFNNFSFFTIKDPDGNVIMICTG
ncbi:VOC family protein [Virgibacillus oceani]|uniref:VOC domain-containing protein n=1 Tax=Virgibacillus oceani TaxID=1479511 RepID=A0A917M167_9BACI|nr:VOC family protein [Virgibacillus oceani]GGG70745.1 hypothetical protein GCM10011398_13620 [Virgibacillus oceani]